jgi:putative transposase
VGVKTLFIERGSPWENGYIESFNGNLRDELIDREIFSTLEETTVLIEKLRREYNQVQPQNDHLISAASSQGYNAANSK